MKQRKKHIDTLRRLYFDAWCYSKSYFLYIVLLIIISSILPFASIYIPKIIVDGIINMESFYTILCWVLIMTISNYLGSVMKQYISFSMSRIEDKFADHCRTRLGRTAMDMEYRYVEDSYVLDELEKGTRGMFWYSGGMRKMTGAFVEIISNILTLIGIVAMVISLKQFYVLLIGIIVLIQIFIEYKNSVYDLRFFKEMNKYNREWRYYNKILQDYEFGKEIRIFGAQSLILGHFKEYKLYSDIVFRKKASQKSFTGFVSAFVNMILQVSAYANICYQIMNGAISLGNFTFLSNAYINIVTKSSAVFYQVFDIRKGCDLIADYYSFIDKYKNEEVDEGNIIDIADDNGYTIEFRNVSFMYPNSDKYVLKNINTTIYSNQKVAIVGKNGAGKTTFIKLLIGLFKPSEGEILLNGKDIREIPFAQYRKLISTVFQDFKTYTASVKDNICMDAQMQENEYKRIISEVGLQEEINNLPYKDDTVLGKKFSNEGQEMSGGQKQRIAIAKALYKASPFLILDEPTAALDVKMEHEIYRLVNECKTTGAVVFISHRLSSCVFCDRILVFDNGHIVQDGNHQELYDDEENLYHELFFSQAKYYMDE